MGEEGRRDEGGAKQKDSRMSAAAVVFIACRDENDWQMAIAGVEGNVTYTATCLERERQEEEELNQQVLFDINV